MIGCCRPSLPKFQKKTFSDDRQQAVAPFAAFTSGNGCEFVNRHVTQMLNTLLKAGSRVPPWRMRKTDQVIDAFYRAKTGTIQKAD